MSTEEEEERGCVLVIGEPNGESNDVSKIEALCRRRGPTEKPVSSSVMTTLSSPYVDKSLASIS